MSILASVQQVLREKNYSNFGHTCEMFDARPISCGFFSQSENPYHMYLQYVCMNVLWQYVSHL